MWNAHEVSRLSIPTLQVLRLLCSQPRCICCLNEDRAYSSDSQTLVSRYLWLYITVFISFLVYISDIFTAVTMLTSTTWSNEIYNSCSQSDHNGCVYIPFEIGKWLFFGCIVFSFLLVRSSAHFVGAHAHILSARIRGAQGEEDHCES